MDLSPEGWGLIVVAVTGLVSWFGRRLETAGARAIASQGAAAEEWQDLAVFHRDRADKAQEQREAIEAEYADLVAELRRQVAGLEKRLAEAGEPVRAADRP